MSIGSRALVLGGGGVTGAGWELGMLCGLARLGADLTTADVIIGTSAGAIVGAQVTTSSPLEDLYAAQLAPPGPREVQGARYGRWRLAALTRAVTFAGDDAEAGRHAARLAAVARTVPPAQRRAMIAARLSDARWPQRDLRITAVEAASGQRRVFDRSSGVDLIDAVTASCAAPLSWPVAQIDGEGYIDGGYHSPANADLAAGYEQVVILAPIPGWMRRSGDVAAQVAAYEPDVRSVVVCLDTQARRQTGRGSLDPRCRAAAAQAGLAQAARIIDTVAEVWS